jgi:alpha-L-fucosidase
MLDSSVSRRDWFRVLGAAGAVMPLSGADEAADRKRRLDWWHRARFGMFVHWGLYSMLGRHEWAMEMEAIPVREYERLASEFKPKPNAAREWAKLARRAGQRYIVMTAKHHEGFCLFETKTTDYCAPRQACGRDLAAEFVQAARAEGLRPGFYFSLMDWHHPDGARCAQDAAARRRFVDYVHAQVRELMTRYGKIDILWYDYDWPLDRSGWESERMNRMVFDLQPDIVVNDRNGLIGDFSTPEQEIVPDKTGHSWETCMTMNESWGYQRADDNWKSARTVVRNLITCARSTGNYLLNIGPAGDGSIPQPSAGVLEAVGSWLEKYGAAIYESEFCKVGGSVFANFTRKGNTLFVHLHFWPGETFSIGGLNVKVTSATLLPRGEPVRFEQSRLRLTFRGLPRTAPDELVTVIALECDGEPTQSLMPVRKERPRDGLIA